MPQTQQAQYLVTPEEYLAGERLASQKHEYLAGVIYAMAGASIGHDRIAGNILRHLGNQLSGQRCETLSSDVIFRIRQDSSEFYYYPDATVDCSGAANALYFAEQPRVIFEVLSPETERIDRGEKLRNYQSIPSLDVYVLVDQRRVAVTIYRRTKDAWISELLTGSQSDVLALPTIGCELSLAALYERTGL